MGTCIEIVSGVSQSLILNLIAVVLFNSFNSEQRLHPLLESIARQIRLRRSTLPGLRPIQLESDFKNIKGKLDGNEMFIKNELHEARGIRKLHLETARLGPGLEILHCVFFPQPTFDIPIFGVDIVSANETILAAIVDLSPVGKELPAKIKDKLLDISTPYFSQVRKLPEWGKIFSKHVQFIRPAGKEEEDLFLMVTDEYLRILVDSLASIKEDPPLAHSTVERRNFQEYYCLQQRRNDKTRMVLARAFNSQWADNYIETLLFECP